jgi:hypothetical protein
MPNHFGVHDAQSVHPSGDSRALFSLAGPGARDSAPSAPTQVPELPPVAFQSAAVRLYGVTGHLRPFPGALAADIPSEPADSENTLDSGGGQQWEVRSFGGVGERGLHVANYVFADGESSPPHNPNRIMPGKQTLEQMPFHAQIHARGRPQVLSHNRRSHWAGCGRTPWISSHGQPDSKVVDSL